MAVCFFFDLKMAAPGIGQLSESTRHNISSNSNKWGVLDHHLKSFVK